MTTLLIRNAEALVSMNEAREILHSVDIYCENGIVSKIGHDLQVVAEDVVLASGMYVYPGLINTHHHLYQTFTRNLPGVQNLELFDWLRALYRIWRGLTPEMVYYSALTGLGELLKYGCTTSVDHHYVFPRHAEPTLIDCQIEAAAELGMRFHPCRGSMSLGESDGGLPPDDVVQTTDEILRDSQRLIERYHDPEPGSMCQISLAPCSPFSVSADLLEQTALLAREYGVRLHTHLAETLDEERFCIEAVGMRPLAYMESLGWLGPDVWYAHGIHFSDEEISLLAQTRTGVAHCPTSNEKLCSGRAPVERLLQAGVPVGLAVDGSASNDCSNMPAEIRTAYLLHRLAMGNQAPTPVDILELATGGGARLIGRPDLGSIEEGKAADMFLVNADTLEWVGADLDPASAPATIGLYRPVDYTIVAGKIVVKDGRLVNIEETAVARKSRELSRRLCRH
jgi:cytosine/adenosine deaminase-related metal-dependent hydrolase